MKLSHLHYAPLFSRLLVALIFAVTFWWLPASVGADDAATTIDVVNLRSGPSLDDETLVTIPAGSQVMITGEAQNGFLPVVYDDQSGWVAQDLVQGEGAATSANSAGNTGMSAKAMHLREGPGKETASLTIMPKGSELQLLGEELDGYVKVSFDGQTGWVLAELVERTAPVSSSNAVVTGFVNMRQEANVDSTLLLRVPANSIVEVTGVSNNGYNEITYLDQTGWVLEEYLVDSAGYVMPEFPILVFHDLGPQKDYTVTRELFIETIDWLAANKFESVTSEDLVAWLDNGVALPTKPVMITVDDGFRSVLDIDIELTKRGFEGVYFLNTVSPLSEEEIRTLDTVGEVCAHSTSHANLEKLGREQLLFEIVENQKYLAGIVGHEVTCFAYPFGSYNETAVQILQESGFELAYDPWWGQVQVTKPVDRWHVPRIMVIGEYTNLDAVIDAIDTRA